MEVSKALTRLLRIRDLEEEQRRLALEAELGELHHLEVAMGTAQARERQGRELTGAGCFSGATADRQAGLVESVVGRDHAVRLAPRIAASENATARLREALLEKRVERRQAETLIEETEANDAVESGRRTQQSLDDWFGARRHRQQADEQR